LERVDFQTSGVLAAAEYDRVTGELVIELLNGGIYKYVKVPVSVFSDLKTTSSAGRFFIEHIRDCYTYERLREKRS
jgi:lysyl-tRNA synthetase, class II